MKQRCRLVDEFASRCRTDVDSVVAQHKQWQLAVAVCLGFLQLILPRIQPR